MTTNRVIVGLGEILWDIFPDGPRFGGAPANFACSAAGLGGDRFEVCMASAVGQDELGEKAIDALLDHHVHADAVARINRPTGQVHVQIDGQGHATYEFASETAWDQLPWSDTLEQLAQRSDVVCFGTLGQRSDVSKQTIRRFVSNTPPGCLRLLDINLRPPFCSDAIILESLAMANALKLNDAELPVVAGLLQIQGSDKAILQQIMTRYSLRIIALTRGADGSLLMRDSGDHSELPGQPVRVVDTVGAGDAFTAALTVGLLSNLTLDTINRWAGQVAAFVCTQSGATPPRPEHLCLPQG